MSEPKIRTAFCRPEFHHSVLTIPGTHGTWPKRTDWSFSRTGFMFIRTREAKQRSFFLTWGFSYVRDPITKKRTVVI